MTEFVYGTDSLAGLVFLPREVAEEQAALVGLLDCGTWGELRAKATPEQFEKILGLAGYGSFEEYTKYLAVGRPLPGVYEEAAESFLEEDKEWPEDDDVFLESEIGAYGDGDWPPDPCYLMAEHLPGEVVEESGEYYETIFNGTYARLDAEADDVAAALRAMGHTCTEDQNLIGRTQARWQTRTPARRAHELLHPLLGGQHLRIASSSRRDARRHRTESCRGEHVREPGRRPGRHRLRRQLLQG